MTVIHWKVDDNVKVVGIEAEEMGSGQPRAPPSTTLLLKVRVSSTATADCINDTCHSKPLSCAAIMEGDILILLTWHIRVRCHVVVLVQNVTVLETLNKGIGQIRDAAVYVKGGVIAWVGPTRDLPQDLTAADTILSLSDHVVIPGLVNTHHHMFQCLTRCIAQVRQ